MTDDLIGEEIPELVEQLAGSLNAPDAAAIHAGLGHRQAARKRILAVAGVFVVVLAIGGGALALNRDDTTSTITADDAAEVGEADAAQGDTVPKDSAPAQDGSVPPRNVTDSWSEPIETAIQITRCSNGVRIQTDGSTWLPGGISQVWADDSPGQVSVIIRGDLLIAIDDTGNAARFSRRLPNTALAEPCNEFSEPFSGQPSDLAATRIPILATLGDVPISDIGGVLTLAPQEDGQGLLEFSSLCQGGAGYWVLWGDEGFTVVEQRPQPPLDESATDSPVRCSGPPPRLDLFEIGDEVRVIVSPDLVVLGLEGETEWQLVLDRRSATGVTFDDAAVPPITTTAPEQSTRTAPAETTTTTTAPPPTGPPSFAPSADTALSGQWEVSGMWNGDVPIDVTEFDGFIRISGETFSGHDGCNDNGKGLFSATADGQVQLESGTSTAQLCLDSEVSDLFLSGAFGANRWGRTSDGSLVLTDGVVVVEFSLG